VGKSLITGKWVALQRIARIRHVFVKEAVTTGIVLPADHLKAIGGFD
jgi:hypothetical protein